MCIEVSKSKRGNFFNRIYIGIQGGVKFLNQDNGFLDNMKVQ